MELGTRLKQRRKELGITQGDLGRAIGVTAATISLWEKGETKPKGDSLLTLAKTLGTTPEWLLHGNGSPALGENTARERVSIQSMIPLISWVQAGDFCESREFEVTDCDTWLPCPASCGPRTYGLKVVGDSMTSPSMGARTYPEGIIVYVDPDKAPVSGDRVIARLEASGDTTFKQYVEDAGQKYLKPLNPSYPMLHMTEASHICGVIIGSYWPE